ncbi:uncharacterized protein TRIADDRAFT_59505 [Trichoplax adhaerens]|uniref:Spondin-like TSP1 domain-containing protein n=1 Tax=Trichoplax adhaerens TaxID=10228 RepID=B3S5L4_TRIAD|nr:hypothetical protein TRIADDRAFT_59505 [Trichoplax adhaerens]EDV21864.1 hypothetical protein TRIADDRAFT_59505 [Trichoplax adhaerens]|eukprot:XP_002115501.1 hypothetical protein TRIADDRAFT_59505 [Trichoplax adhaerens]
MSKCNSYWICFAILLHLVIISNANNQSSVFRWDCLVSFTSVDSQPWKSYGRFYCIYKPTHKISPYYYCRDIPKPKDINSPCSNSTLSHILTSWNSWQSNSSLNLRYRTRTILYSKVSNFKSKPKLMEMSILDQQHEENAKFTRWIVGPWSSCKQQSILNSNTATSMARSSQHMLPTTISKRYRTVQCVSYDGHFSHGCSIQARPHAEEICAIGSQCQVSSWSSWSDCQFSHNPSKSPQIGIQSRKRHINYLNPDNGIYSCPPLLDQRTCKLIHKPKPQWKTGEWSLCQIRWPSLLAGQQQCGNVGWQSRAVWCVNDRGNMVNEKYCQHDGGQENKPVFNRLCIIDCKRDCLVGPWSEWSSCCSPYRSFSRRHRQVLIPPKQNGQACPPLTESRNCSMRSCYQWFADKWSTCLLSNANSRPYCQTGRKFRSVYCIDQNHRMVMDRYCKLWKRPAFSKSCTLPCLNDCILSRWSDWQTETLQLIPIRLNSTMMMLQENRQVRIRYILADPGVGGKPCPYSSQLIESMTVRHYLPIWITQSWSNCTCFADGCYQYRTVNCFDVFEKRILPMSLCQYRMQPPLERKCHDQQQERPLHCQLSPWSDWSSPPPSSSMIFCKPKAQNKRLRVVLQYHSVGGHPCPSNMTRNGLIVEYTKLTNLSCISSASSSSSMPYSSSSKLSSTNFYTWRTGSWQACLLLNFDRRNPLCGVGMQSRMAQCIHLENNNIVALNYCLKNRSLKMPEIFRKCFVPCQGDCSLTPWSAWSNCSQSCSNHWINPNRKRYRTFTNYNREEGLRVCRYIDPSHLEQQSKCTNRHCFEYAWLPSPWSSCLLKASNCGQGLQHRHLTCQRNDSIIVDHRWCQQYAKNKLAINRRCFKNCSIDCIVSTWSVWNPCQHDCGDSLRNRTRTVLRAPQYGGRPCPSLFQLEICQERLCHDIRWHYTTWSQCLFRNLSKRCGQGFQSRKVYCSDRHGHVLDDQRCLLIADKPNSVESCHIACPGKCVYSLWTPWQPGNCILNLRPINNRTSGKPQCRTRRILRQTRKRYECLQPNLLFQQRYIDEDQFSWDAGSWATCRTYPRSRCGDGLQYRPIYCKNQNQQIVATSLCKTRPPEGVRGCREDCDVDCALSPWSDWSSCSKSCGLKGISTRHRSILFNATGIGKACPSSQQLQQQKSCNIRPCVNYIITRSSWSACKTSQRQCGYGRKSRSITCTRYDGKYFDLTYCLNQKLTQSMQEVKNFTKLNELIQFMDIDVERNCYIPCKDDCVMTSWSSFSPCYRNCNRNDSQPHRIRVRHVLRPSRYNGQKCPTNNIQIINCTQSQAQCAQVEWQTSPWQNGTRQVWCLDVNTGYNVTGCDELTKPSTKKSCDSKCNEPYKECQEGQCICKNGTEGDGQICLPKSGCFNNHHCPVANMKCGPNQQCQCINGYHMNCTSSNHCQCFIDEEDSQAINCPVEEKTSTSGTIHISKEPALAIGCKRKLHLPKAHNITVQVEFFNHHSVISCAQNYLKLVPSRGKATVLCANLVGRHQLAFPVDSLLVDYHNRMRAILPELPTFVMEYAWDKK